jgi:hypothetical protein
MLNAMEQLMRLHPGSRFGRLERHHSDLAAFKDLESRHLCPRHEYETDRSQPMRMIGEVTAAAATLVVFIAVLTVIAHFAVDAPDTGQQPMVAVSEVSEPR